jgi:hypothetical protein
LAYYLLAIQFGPTVSQAQAATLFTSFWPGTLRLLCGGDTQIFSSGSLLSGLLKCILTVVNNDERLDSFFF